MSTASSSSFFKPSESSQPVVNLENTIIVALDNKQASMVKLMEMLENIKKETRKIDQNAAVLIVTYEGVIDVDSEPDLIALKSMLGKFARENNLTVSVTVNYRNEQLLDSAVRRRLTGLVEILNIKNDRYKSKQLIDELNNIKTLLEEKDGYVFVERGIITIYSSSDGYQSSRGKIIPTSDDLTGDASSQKNEIFISGDDCKIESWNGFPCVTQICVETETKVADIEGKNVFLSIVPAHILTFEVAGYFNISLTPLNVFVDVGRDYSGFVY